MNEASGTTLFDSSSFIDGSTGTGLTRGVAGSLLGDSDTATTFDGTANGTASTPTAVQGPNVFTVEAWFKTTTTAGGKIIGFGAGSTGNSGSYDRHVYMDNTGKVYFGVYTGSTQTINSTKSYNDGQWHQVVASMGPSGMALYVDDALAGTRPAVTAGQAYAGFWRVGGDNLNGWPAKPTSNYFAGAIDEVAIYPSVLTAAQVSQHFAIATSTANQAPVAAFTSSSSALVASFDGSGSSDPDGTVASYAWDFGDSTAAGSGATPSHTYAVAGTYQVKLTVTDNKGATNAVTKPVTVAAANQAPVAAFTSSSSALVASFDGSGSSDPDGTVASYAWDFGDSTAAGSGATPSHTYAVAGTYQVKLTVTDNKGATNAVTKPVTVAAANQAPVAAFTSSSSALVASFDGSGSSDPDGTVASYAWDFGDSTAAGSGATPSHTYAVAGTYQVKLTVTDNKGATNAVTKPVTVAAANQAPVAAFTSSSSALVASFDGSGSSDPDGTVASYAWDFGDSTAAGSGATPSHTYAVAGTYQVKLTVTDNKGATNAVTKPVTVAAESGTFADDLFARTVSSGWGSADQGGTWSVSGSGGARNFSVAPGIGSMKMPTKGSTVTATLSGVSQADADVRVKFSSDLPPTGGGIYFNTTARRVSNSYYTAKAIVGSTGKVSLQLVRVVAGAETVVKSAVAASGITYTPGMVLHVRFQAVGTGTTTLNAKVWRDGQTEPAAWLTTVKDSTAALQSAGGVGVSAYLSSTATNAPVTWLVEGFQASAP